MAGADQSPTLQRIARKLQARTPGLMGEKQLAKYAVLVPLVRMETGGVAVLFEKRARTVRQAGEICFPGGRIEPTDSSPWAAARRETSEELGLPLEQIECFGELDTLVAPSSMCIYPFVGLLREHRALQPNTAEVEEVFLLSLDQLMAAVPDVHEVPLHVQPQEDYPFHLIPNGADYPWRTPKVHHLFYTIDGRVIWGLTARILQHFLEVAGREGV